MDTGATVSFTFTGNRVTWLAYRDPWSGIARVYIDGDLKATVDTHSINDQARSPVYSSPELQWGPHTITIEVTGQQNPMSMARWIWIDAFDYVGTPD
jgi:hypothetical protein